MVCRKFKCLCAAVFSLFLAFPTALSFAWGGKVVGVSDGDTVTVLSSSHEQIRVRLYGIDAPESEQPFGTKSKQSLSGLLFGKTVEVDEVDVDRYGRVVGCMSARLISMRSRSGGGWRGCMILTVVMWYVLIGDG